MSLQPITILGYDTRGGLQTSKKPFLIPEEAFQKLENFYAWRDQVKKREGIKLVGRLQRNLTGESLGMTAAGPPNTFTVANIFVTLGITGENPELVPGSLEIIVSAPDAASFTDIGDGTFLVTGAGVSAGSYVNYATGEVVLNFSALVGGATVTADLSYNPGLPVMGIQSREIASINDEQTIFFDTKYAYIWGGAAFQEFIPGTTWNGSNSDFFWSTNYRGVNPQDRLFFTTNFFNDAGSPIRYTDGATWTSFSPAVDATNFLFQARILIPYYGRLLALNVYEGTAVGTAVNIFNRCRFSQLGSPIAADAWRSDQFGKGGFIDAPTNEAIINATFLNNTLVVFFERTTWQLRYVGEYGLPFIWERVASDLGSESTFSPVLFNNTILAIGDKAIVSADSNAVTRIDLNILDQIFDFQNAENGVKRVQGIRNYQKELVYWCYADAQTQAAPGSPTVFPNKVLLYNYRNETWAIFRDNVTAFGTLQITTDVLWDSQVIYWDDEEVIWDDVDTQSRFPLIVSGNQQGFVHYYQYSGPQSTPQPVAANEQPSLSITSVTFATNLLSLEIINHNLQEGEIIYLTGLQFLDAVTFDPVATDLNDNFYQVRIDSTNQVTLLRWDFQSQSYFTNFSFTPVIADSIYIGGGTATLFPVPLMQTKDFNPFFQKSMQSKVSYMDFLFDTTSSPPQGTITGASKANPCVITSPGHGLQSGQKITISNVQGMTQLNTSQTYYVTFLTANTFSINVNSTSFGTYTSGGIWTLVLADVSVEIFLNSSTSISGNLLVGNTQLSAFGIQPFYGPGSQYQWHRFYATFAGQYFNMVLTYDDDLMNTLRTHQKELVLNSITIWTRPAGKLPF